MVLSIIVLLLALSAFFSGAEIAFAAANRLRVQVLARRDGIVGPVVRDFMQRPSTFLATTLVGKTVALVAYASATALFLSVPVEHLFSNAAGRIGGARYILDLAALVFVSGFIVLVIGEILPKSLMRAAPHYGVFLLAVPLRISYYVLLPIIWVAPRIAALLVRLLRVGSDSFAEVILRDVGVTLQEGSTNGESDLDDEDSELLSNVFSMNTIRVKESMVPRTDVVAVEESTPVGDLLQRFIETGHSKLPVYRENVDDIVGVVFAYDLFDEPATIIAIMRPAQFVPESKRSKDLLREFLASNTSVAIVIDEYGGTAGLVTREDLLEELFGDIQDEFDTEEEILRQTGENSYIASGRVAIDDLCDRSGIELPDGDYETIAGYLLERLGSIPAPQEQFVFDGYRFDILKATTNRIDLVRIRNEGGTSERA